MIQSEIDGLLARIAGGERLSWNENTALMKVAHKHIPGCCYRWEEPVEEEIVTIVTSPFRELSLEELPSKSAKVKGIFYPSIQEFAMRLDYMGWIVKAGTSSTFKEGALYKSGDKKGERWPDKELVHHWLNAQPPQLPFQYGLRDAHWSKPGGFESATCYNFAADIDPETGEQASNDLLVLPTIYTKTPDVWENVAKWEKHLAYTRV